MDVFKGSFMGIWITCGIALLIILKVAAFLYWKKRRKKQEQKKKNKQKKKKKKDKQLPDPQHDDHQSRPAITPCDQCGSMDIVTGPCPECGQDTTACLDCSARLAPCACDAEVLVDSTENQQPQQEDNPNILQCECGNKKWMRIQCQICKEDTIVGCSECEKPLTTCMCNEPREDKPQKEVPQQEPQQESIQNQQLKQQIASLKKALKIRPQEGVDPFDHWSEVSEVLEREPKAEQKKILTDWNPIKCECGSMRVARIQCTQCGQGIVECLECDRRLWSCGCDESKNDVDHPGVSASEDLDMDVRAAKPKTRVIREAFRRLVHCDIGGHTQKCWNREIESLLCVLKRNQINRLKCKNYRNQMRQLVEDLDKESKRLQNRITTLKSIVCRQTQIKQREAAHRSQHRWQRCRHSNENPDIAAPELIDLTVRQIQNQRRESNRAERRRKSLCSDDEDLCSDSDLCSDDVDYPKRRMIQQINRLKRNESRQRGRSIQQTLNRWREAARATQDRWQQRQRFNQFNESPDVPELTDLTIKQIHDERRESNHPERMQSSRPFLMECQCGSSNLREFVCVPCDHRTMKCTECRQCIRPCGCDRVQYRAGNEECCPLEDSSLDLTPTIRSMNEGLNGNQSDVSNTLEEDARKQMDTFFHKNMENTNNQEVRNKEQCELKPNQRAVRWTRRKIV